MNLPTPTKNPEWLPEVLNGQGEERFRDKVLKYCTDYDAMLTLLNQITVRAQYCGMLKYFDGDTKPRPVFLITLTRGERSAVYSFGASLNDGEVIAATRLLFSGDVPPPLRGKYFTYGNEYNRALKAEREKYPADLLYGVLCSCGSEGRDPGTFADYCSMMGGNTDSIKDREAYFTIQEMYEKLRAIFTQDEIDLLPS